MTIREIEDATGLPRANVRYYESLGLIHPARAANGYRDYRQEDLDTLLKIKLLRQLDCSLEDIQALEKGTRSLDQVLSEVGDALEKKRRRPSTPWNCAGSCGPTAPVGTISSRSATSSGIPPSPRSSPPVRDASDTLGNRCPWRRYFARTLDYALCLTLWELFLSLVLRVNILSTSFWLNVVNVAMALGLMCVLEAACLHFFGHHPGSRLSLVSS